MKAWVYGLYFRLWAWTCTRRRKDWMQGAQVGQPERMLPYLKPHYLMGKACELALPELGSVTMRLQDSGWYLVTVTFSGAKMPWWMPSPWPPSAQYRALRRFENELQEKLEGLGGE